MGFVKRPTAPPEPPWLPPPEPNDCLIHAYSSNPQQKGGTLIAEDVTDREAHRRRLAAPGGYRLSACPRCGWGVLHVHDYRERVAWGERRVARKTRRSEAPESDSEIVVRYLCASEACGATWCVLPAFLARHLWYSWRAVERATMHASVPEQPVEPAPNEDPPPRQTAARTVGRWRERLASAALLLVQLLASSGAATFTGMETQLGTGATRGQLVAAYDKALSVPEGRRLSVIAGHIHRLAPGVRLM